MLEHTFRVARKVCNLSHFFNNKDRTGPRLAPFRPDMRFVQNFTLTDIQTKTYTIKKRKKNVRNCWRKLRDRRIVTAPMLANGLVLYAGANIQISRQSVQLESHFNNKDRIGRRLESRHLLTIWLHLTLRTFVRKCHLLELDLLLQKKKQLCPQALLWERFRGSQPV